MQRISEKQLVVAGLMFIGLIFSVLAFITEIPAGGADNYAHFNIARWAFKYPHLFLDHWGKPVFTILTAPFSLLGFGAVRIFNTVCGLLTAWFVYRLAGLFNLKHAWFALFPAIFTPIYFVMMSSGMTEILFSLILTISIYLFFREKYIYSALLISFIFLVRTEGLAFFLLFIIGFLLKRQYKAIPFLAAGFLIFSVTGGIYYDDFLWLITKRPYATGAGPSVYGSGEWYYFIEKMPGYFGYVIPVFLFGGTIILLINWIQQKAKLNNPAFTQILLILGTFWGYFFIHSYLWWVGETSAGLFRVMAAVSPLIGVVAVYFADWVARFIRFEKIRIVVLSLVAVFLIAESAASYHRSISRDLSTEILKRVTAWLKESGSLNHKIVMHNPYFAFSTGVDAWDNNIVQYGFSNNDIPENGLPDSTIFIWDAHFSANEGRLPLDKIMNNTNFELVQYFEPIVPFKVLGNNDYCIFVFRKISNSGVNNSLLLQKLKAQRFESGVYFVDIFDFEKPFPEEYMEIRRVKSELDSSNFIYQLNNIEFCPAFHVPAAKLENATKSKFRVTADICLIDSVQQNRLLMVFSAETSKGSWYYVTSDIAEQIPDRNVWYKTEFVFSLPVEPENETVIKSYIWNIDKSNVLIDNFKIEIAKQTKNNL